MSAITTRRPPSPKSPSPPPAPGDLMGDQRIVIRGADWDLYDRISEAIGEGQHVRVAFDGKDLELMSTGYMHEDYKVIFGQFLGALIFELAIRAINAGETTWKRVAIARGLEADHSFFSTPRSWPNARPAVGSSRTTWTTIPTPTWPSRSMSPGRRSIGLGFMPPCGSRKSGDSMASPW